MFDLEQSIAEWRRQMIGAGIKSPVPLEELESHLREEVQTRVRSGVAPERAFALAVGQIGGADKLNAEFAKVCDAKKMRMREYVRRWSVIVGTVFVYVMLSATWYLGVRSGKIEISGVDIVLAAGAMAPMILLGWAGRSFAKLLPVVSEYRVVAMAVGTLFLAAVLFRIFFPALSPTNFVRVQIFSLWALSPMIGFGNCVSAWFDRCAELRKKAA